MMQIADFFSSFIHSIVQYKTDYNATGKMDYVGMNSFNGTLVALYTCTIPNTSDPYNLNGIDSLSFNTVVELYGGRAFGNIK